MGSILRKQPHGNSKPFKLLIMSEQLTTKNFFARADVRSKFEEMLGNRAPQFITSVLQIANSNALLAQADPLSIYNAAALAATLDLPLNNSLGFAYIIPFGEKQKDGSYLQKAQFQIGYKGLIQLAQRSGQFKTISVAPIFEGQLVSENPLTGFEFDFTKKSEKVIGYASFFSLINGFEKTLYMSVEELNKHGIRFSQTYKKGYGLWKDDFDSMARKTVLKLLLSKFAPLSVSMQKAVITDQSIINDVETMDVTYTDNPQTLLQQEAKSKEEIEEERLIGLINSATTIKELQNAVKGAPMTAKATELFNQKVNEIDAKG